MAAMTEPGPTHLDIAERRRRLVSRHFLATPGPDVESVAGAMCGLHATDPATVALAAKARLEGFDLDQLDDALYRRRSVARMLGMRRTLFVVPRDLMAIVDAACTQSLLANERRIVATAVERDGVEPDGQRWIDETCDAVLGILETRGPLTARELSERSVAMRTKLTIGATTRNPASVSVGSRILFLLATQGRIVRDRPVGTWLSTLHRWAPMHRHFDPFPPMEPAHARAELLGRWLSTFGPATPTDIAWWAKWTKTQTRSALDAIAAEPVTVDTGNDTSPADAFVVAGDSGVTSLPPGPNVSLLPSLDPTIMGWKQRAWYLGSRPGDLFDSNGNSGPVVMVDGAVVGVWAQDSEGTVVTELIAPPPLAVRRLIAARAADLTRWLAGTRVVPRFPTPMQRRLSGG
ncbi:winged helix DNA-binding domain-containing protein [soil metagenome]